MDYIVEINDSKIEKREITIELIKELSVNGEIPAPLIKTSNLIIKYHWQKNKEPLINSIKTEPHIYQHELMKKFLTLIVEGKYRALRKGSMSTKTLEKYKKAFDRFMYYREMKIPIDGSDFSCVKLASKDASIAPFTLINEILTKIDTKNINPLNGSIPDGFCIRILNGDQPPKNIETLRELELKKQELSEDESREIHKHYLNLMLINDPYCTIDPKKSAELKSKIERKYMNGN